jgi:hypothetical protein
VYEIKSLRKVTMVDFLGDVEDLGIEFDADDFVD